MFRFDGGNTEKEREGNSRGQQDKGDSEGKQSTIVYKGEEGIGIK